MNLYHYSEEKHKVIQSLQAREAQVSGDRLKLDPSGILPPYNTSISFFLNQIPNDLPALLDDKHKFWQPKDLFEYQVKTSTLPDDIIFYIAEAPERNKIVDKFDWSKASDPEVRKSFLKEIRDWEISNGLIGQGVKNLESKAKLYTGSLSYFYKKAYQLAKKENELESFFSKYASYVPHVMIYHKDFKISNFTVKEKTLVGKNNLGTELFKNSPISLKL